MPVRMAVNQLVEEKFLNKLPNGRVCINWEKYGTIPHDQVAKVIVAPPTNWFKIVTDDIYLHSLRQKPRVMRIDATAKQFGISKSLVHSIFHRLAGIGLLQHEPRRGWLTRSFDVNDLDSFLQTRELIELQALDLVRDKLDRTCLERLLVKNSPLPGQPLIFDNSLHRYWIDLSGNPYFIEFFDRHGKYFNTLLEYAELKDDLKEELAAQHRMILESMLRRDWRRAKNYLIFDIQRLRPILVETLQRINEPAPAPDSVHGLHMEVKPVSFRAN